MSMCQYVFCSVLQCVAVCCSVLQYVAVCCSVLQYVAVCCGVTLSPLCMSARQYMYVCVCVCECVSDLSPKPCTGKGFWTVLYFPTLFFFGGTGFWCIRMFLHIRVIRTYILAGHHLIIPLYVCAFFFWRDRILMYSHVCYKCASFARIHEQACSHIMIPLCVLFFWKLSFFYFLNLLTGLDFDVFASHVCMSTQWCNNDALCVCAIL